MNLHISDSVLRKAFFYAKEQGVDLSVMVEAYLNKFVTFSSQKDKAKEFPVSEQVRSLAGRLTIAGKDIDWEKEKESYFADKYGL